MESFHEGESFRPQYECGLNTLFFASPSISIILYLVREPKRHFIGENGIVLLFRSYGMGLATKAWKKVEFGVK